MKISVKSVKGHFSYNFYTVGEPTVIDGWRFGMEGTKFQIYPNSTLVQTAKRGWWVDMQLKHLSGVSTVYLPSYYGMVSILGADGKALSPLLEDRHPAARKYLARLGSYSKGAHFQGCIVGEEGQKVEFGGIREKKVVMSFVSGGVEFKEV